MRAATTPRWCGTTRAGDFRPYHEWARSLAGRRPANGKHCFAVAAGPAAHVGLASRRLPLRRAPQDRPTRLRKVLCSLFRHPFRPEGIPNYQPQTHNLVYQDQRAKRRHGLLKPTFEVFEADDCIATLADERRHQVRYYAALNPRVCIWELVARAPCPRGLTRRAGASRSSQLGEAAVARGSMLWLVASAPTTGSHFDHPP